ncbi:MAG: hypothetical protein ACI9K2_007244, partial [Myxococcota bacterium]
PGPGESGVAGDCDDGRADVHPGAEEPDCALEDRDCDGIAPWCLRTVEEVTHSRWEGAVPDTRLGSAAALADLNGDGSVEVVVAASHGGDANAVWGLVPVLGLDAAVDAVPITGVLLGDGGAGGVGRRVVYGGDPAGIGVDAVWLAVGDDWWLERLDGAPSRVTTLSRVGWLDDAAPLAGGDLDGTGSHDIAFVGPGVGGVRAWTDLPEVSLSLDDAPAQVTGCRTLGNTAAAVGDVDGDGRADVALGGCGATWVIPVVATGDAADLAVYDVDETPDALLGPGDLDGDGHPDLVLWREGVAYVLAGPLVGRGVLEAAAATVVAPAAIAAGDVQGDGRADLWFGTELLAGPLLGTLDLADEALWTIQAGDALPVAAGRDLDGDLRPDLVLGDPLGGVDFRGVVTLVGTAGL